MATSSPRDVCCEICEEQHVTAEANVWCPKCEECLCRNCEKQHIVSKSSTKHNVIGISDYLNIPKPILYIDHHCPEHDRKYQMFCTRHDDICCPLCVSSYHKSCTGLLAIEEVVDKLQSDVMDNTERILDNLIKNVNDVIENREQNLVEIKDKRQLFQNQISNLANRLIAHISKLEKHALKELRTHEKNITNHIECALTKFTEKAQVMIEFHESMSALKKSESKLQMYLGLKTMTQDIEEEEKQVKLLFKEDNLQRYNLKCKINESVASEICSMQPLISVQNVIEPTSLWFKSCTKIPVQMSSNSLALFTGKNLDPVDLALDTEFKVAKGKRRRTITGCTVLTGGKMVFADCDPNKRLVICSPNGTFVDKIFLSPSRPFDVVGLDENTVAVSVWNPNEIQVVNIKKKEIVRRYDAKNIRGGLVHFRDKFIYRNRQGLVTLKESDESIAMFVKENKNPLTTYVATTGDHIFASNNEENTVTCYGLDGKMVWKYKNKRLLKTPFGITVDNKSNVYVVSSFYKNILIISPDGKRSRLLLDIDFFSESPRAIAFDKERNRLLVVTDSGCAHLFKVP